MFSQVQKDTPFIFDFGDVGYHFLSLPSEVVGQSQSWGFRSHPTARVTFESTQR